MARNSSTAKSMAESESLPKWAQDCGLKKSGLYYEGYVQDIDLVRQQRQADTVSTFGVRKSWSSGGGNTHGKQEVNYSNLLKDSIKVNIA